MIISLLNIITFLFFLVTPGYLLLALLGLKTSIKNLPVYFVASAIIWTPISQIAYFYNIKLVYLIYILIVINISLLIILIIKIYLNGVLMKIIKDKKIYLKVATSIFVVIATYIISSYVFPTNYGSDGPFHFAHVGNMISQEKIVNEEAMVILDDENKVYPGYKNNAWYVAWSSVATISDSSSRRVANHLNPFLFLLSLLSVSYLATSLSNKEKGILPLTIVMSIATVLIFRPLDGMLMYFPNRIGYLIFLPAITGIFINYLKTDKQPLKYLLLFTGALGIGAAGAFHNMAFLYAFILCATYAFLKFFTVQDKPLFIKNNLPFFIVALIAVAPIMLMRSQEIAKFSSFTAERGKTSRLIYWNEHFYFYYFGIRGIAEYILATVIAVGTSVYLQVKKIKSPDWLILFFAGLLLVIGIRQNPLVAPIATNIVSATYVNRLVYILPSVILFSFVYQYFIISRLGAKKGFPLLIIATLSFLLLSPYKFSESTIEEYRQNPDRFKRMGGVASYINNNIPPKSRIATEIESGYEITARANVRTILAASEHVKLYLGIRGYNDRLDELAVLFEPSKSDLDPQKRDKILKKYDIDYILVTINNSYVQKKNPDYDGEKFIKTIEANDSYSNIYQDNNYVLYKIME